MKISYKDITEVLNQFNKKEVIEFAIVLYRNFYLEEKDLDYTKLPEAVRRLLGYAIGINYNNVHPTEESRNKESYSEWIRKQIKKINIKRIK